jgi:pyruvate dehydrogenase E2 component (dihydrolipoamide acetyltransferase)
MNSAAGLVEVRVPDMGNFKDVAIIDVLVKPGEKIEPEAPLVTLETEKATMDVPSTVGGVVEKIHIAKGGTVSPGDLIVTVRLEAASGDGSVPADSQATATAASSAGSATATSGGATSAGGSSSAPAKTAAGPAKPASAAPAQSAADGPAQPASATTAPQSAGTAQRAPQSAVGGLAQAASATGPQSAGTTQRASSVPGASRATASAPRAVDARPVAPPSSATPEAPGQTSPQSQNGAGPANNAGASLDLPPINEPGFSRAHAGPSVRRFARELGVDLTQVKGGGFKGRVTHDDVKAFVKKFLAAGAAIPAAAKGGPAPGGGTSLPAVPVIDFTQFGPIETKQLSRIQKISGPRLHASWVNIPHVTQFDEADITDLEDVRTQLKQKALEAGIKLTPLAFIVRACVKALQEFPLFNSSLDPTGANLILKKYIHVGFAADTPNGLVVPVLRDANRRDVYEIARQLGELSEKARAGKLSAAEMQGGSFTISSLGGIGGTAFTPIINAPEVAILGVSRSAMKPEFRDGAFVPRLILPLSLSYDHRVIDGATAARFTTFLAQTLADPRGLMEAVP